MKIRKTTKALSGVSALFLTVGTASAGTFSCGTHEISDEEIPGQSRAEIQGKCGAPQDRSGDNLYYRRGDVTYRLHFNDNDELESIEEVRE
jgi:hypothetical protein